MKNKSTTQRILIYWIPVLIWAGFIFYLSDISGLRGGFSTPVEIVLRKIAHAGEFGFLAIFVLLLLTKGYSVELKKSVMISLLLVALYALSDELHQSFVAARDGNFKDVTVDILGAYIFLHLAVFVMKRKIEKRGVINICLSLAMFVVIVSMLVWEAIQIQNEKQQLQKFQRNSVAETVLEKEEISNEELKEPEVLIQSEEKIDEETNKKQKINELPGKVLVEVPFSSQAPFGVWDDVHQEACEEMSLIMVKYYLDGEKLSRETAEQEILELKEFQEKKFGHYKDSSMEELVKIAEEFYKIDSFKIIYDFDKSEIKKQLAKGKPIIVPSAGRRLGNPNFTPPGPLYHNLVLIGYDGETIITNDPGTRKGEKYTYSLDILYNSIHDYEGDKEKIEMGRKAMIILE